MKRGIKITLCIVAVIVVLLLILSFIISPIARWYIEEHSKELVGRRVTVENVNIKLLLGRLDVDNFVLYEANDVDTFVSIEHLDADMRVWGILRKSIEVDSINIVTPHATILREGNGLNFDDMLTFFANKASGNAENDTTPSDWRIVLRNIGLDNGVIRYADDVLHIDWIMNHIKLNIPELDLSGSGTDAQLYLDFARGGHLELKAMYDQQLMDYDMNCRITDYPLGVLMPFMEGMVNVGDVRGKLAVDLHAKGNVENIMASDFDGAIKLDSVVVHDVEGGQLLSLKEFKTDIEHINVAKDYVIRLRELSVDELVTQFEVYKDGTNNFTSLMSTSSGNEPSKEVDVEPAVASDTIQSEKAPRLDLTITDLQLKNSNFTYTDHTLPEPFTMRLSKIRFKSPDFTMQGQNSIELFSVLQETGALRIKWDGNIETQEHDLMISLNNFNLKDVSPYSLSFFGYPITDGKLSFTGQNIISNGELKGANKLSMYHPTLDKKRSDIDAEYGMIPLKLAIVVLTDRQGKADIDLPVSGNIHSPHFSYGKIIVQALVNVLVKIAAAPFDLLAGALGLSSDEVKEIEFDAWQHQFTPEQYDKIEKLSRVIAEKPELALRLIHEVNYEKGIQAIVENDFRREYYLSMNPDRAASLNMVDVDAYRKLALKGEAVMQFADSLLVARGLSVEGSLSDKMHRLYGATALDKLMRNVEMRDRGMTMQWCRALNMPEGTLQIVSPSRDEVIGSSGKTRYKVEMSVVGEHPTQDGLNDENNATEAVVTDGLNAPVE